MMKNTVKKYVTEMLLEYGKVLEMDGRTWRAKSNIVAARSLRAAFLFTSGPSLSYSSGEELFLSVGEA